MIFDAHNPSDSIEKNSLEKEKVVIIIPTHNEASVIQTTVEQVFTSVELIERYDIHILIFDSASTDNTQQIVASLQKIIRNYTYKMNPPNLGLGLRICKP